MSSRTDKGEGLVDRHTLQELRDLHAALAKLPDEHGAKPQLDAILWLAIQVKRVRATMEVSDG